jgi:plasmid stabilization system protein ParE
MRLRWTPAAAEDLESIGDYLGRHLPSFARSTIQEIYQTILTLRSTPYRGGRFGILVLSPAELLQRIGRKGIQS